MTTEPNTPIPIESLRADLGVLFTNEDMQRFQRLAAALTELEELRKRVASGGIIPPKTPCQVDDLAMLVRLLVHSIRKHSPDNETARKAMDYLRRHELQGSPLRSILSPAPDAAQPNNQQEQP